MPTLAELRAQSGPKPLPRDTKLVTLVEGQHLLAEAEGLVAEMNDLGRQMDTVKRKLTRANDDGERTGEPRKAGQGAADVRRVEDLETRMAEIEARLAVVPDELADHQGEIGLVGMEGGDWQRFKDAHPPREEVDEDGVRVVNRNDMALASSMCNATAVFEALGQFVRTWDGEAVTETDWDEWLAARIAYADRRDLVRAVVTMHERGAARSPKFRSASPTTSPSESG